MQADESAAGKSDGAEGKAGGAHWQHRLKPGTSCTCQVCLIGQKRAHGAAKHKASTLSKGAASDMLDKLSRTMDMKVHEEGSSVPPYSQILRPDTRVRAMEVYEEL